MLELYHNALSTCSQKVRMALGEKGLEYVSHPVDLVGGAQHDPAFVAISPKHVVPILVDDGRVIRESSIINEYINELEENPPLAPVGPYARAQMRLWVKRVDEEIHGRTTGVFTHAIWTSRFVGAGSPEQIDAYLNALPDPAERNLRRSLIVDGAAAPEFTPAVMRMANFLDDLDDALSKNRWIAGATFSLADICVLPYVVRLEETGLSALWIGGRRPHVACWLDDMKARPSYKTAFTDWVPPPMAAGLASLADQAKERIATAIDTAEGTRVSNHG